MDDRPPEDPVRTDTDRDVVVARTGGASGGSIILAVVLAVLAVLLVIWLLAGNTDPNGTGTVAPDDTSTSQVETTAPIDSTAPVETSVPTETTVAP